MHIFATKADMMMILKKKNSIVFGIGNWFDPQL